MIQRYRQPGLDPGLHAARQDAHVGEAHIVQQFAAQCTQRTKDAGGDDGP